MSPIVMIFVRFDSAGLVVFEYSHDLIAKKNAPIISCDEATDNGSFPDEYSLRTQRMTDTGIAFCLTSLLSCDLNPCKIRLMLSAVFPSVDNRGSGMSFSKNVCATVLRVFLIVPSASSEIPPACVGRDRRNCANSVKS